MRWLYYGMAIFYSFYCLPKETSLVKDCGENIVSSTVQFDLNALGRYVLIHCSLGKKAAE